MFFRPNICNTCCSKASLVIVKSLDRLDEGEALTFRDDFYPSLGVVLKLDALRNADLWRTATRIRCELFLFSDFHVVTDE